jgi:hypothetical protein
MESLLERLGGADRATWLVTLVAAVALMLVLINIVAERSLRARQSEVATRQAYIEESRVLSKLNEQIIQMLASLAAENNDESIRSMLLGHGVTYSVKPPSSSAPDGKRAP